MCPSQANSKHVHLKLSMYKGLSTATGLSQDE